MTSGASRNWRRRSCRVLRLPDYISYECRIGYPLQELEKRIAVLGAGHDYVKQWLRCSLRCSPPAAEPMLPSCRRRSTSRTICA